MSRLIVKNLPSGIKEERLRKLFGETGEITDCNLKFTHSGHFRKFAFIGYKTEKEAQAALNQFNRTFIDTSRLQIEIARDFGDVDKPRAWSKYSKESSANQKADEEKRKLSKETADKKLKKKDKKKQKEKQEVVNELLGELKDDASFQEFLDVHQNVGAKPVWTNDSMKTQKAEKELKRQVDSDDESDDADDDDDDVEISKSGDEDEEKDADTGGKVAQQTEISDLDYLKSKVGNRAFLSDTSSSDDSSDESSSDDDDLGSTKEKLKKKLRDKKHKKEESEKEKSRDKSPEKTKESDSTAVYMIEMKGLPANASEKSIKEFFHPLNIAKIRIPRNAKNKPLGVAYVGFNSEKDVNQALGRNKNFSGGKRIFLKKTQAEVIEEVSMDKPRPWEFKKADDADEEDIAETGRLFVRNLPYSCTEEDLEEKFKKFGPLTEVTLPIDSLTKKLKGFAFITYMIPEHAVRAYAELDGKIFQGRMLHILPGKEKKEPTEEGTEGSSYKKQKQAKQKALAQSSHNWNALFLGANAVADVLAEKYEAAKSKILDTDIRGSLGVRMALGETQVVTETRKFLTTNGVSLDSFSQANAPRSKTVMLVKNLPAGTTTEELQEVFSKHGTLGRVLLPPSGVTAIVEYLAPTEARTGFTRLAYTKFHNVPLYLEWAPMEVFKETTEIEMDDKEIPADDTKDKMVKQEDSKDTEKKPEKKTETVDDEPEESVPGSTLFVKNINFDTTEETLRKEFNCCSKVKTATIARKKDVKNPGSMLSMGYGFVEFVSPEGAKKALKQLQHTNVDGHQLELKISNRTTLQPKTAERKKQKAVDQKTTKVLVRNIPFEAKSHEVEELFKVFGELKSVRLPKKLGGTGSHRGFGFVDFLTKQDAKRAFEALCHSTHLYGRRLVLEWAETTEDIDDIRKRTAEHFHNDGGRKKFTKSGLKDHLEMMEDD